MCFRGSQMSHVEKCFGQSAEQKSKTEGEFVVVFVHSSL